MAPDDPDSGAAGRREALADAIHGDAIQAATAAGMRLHQLRATLVEPAQLALADHAAEAVALTVDRLRLLLFELGPPPLEHGGLAHAVELVLAAGDRGTAFTLDDRIVFAPDAATGLLLYRVAQEAVANVRRHARATSAVVTMVERDGGHEVSVADDGVGFTPTGRFAPGHAGLAAARERAEGAGGLLEVTSRPGAGTVVRCFVPRRPAAR